MQTLISEGIARLAGASSQAIFHLKQAMGGGKTHLLVGFGLLALHPGLSKTYCVGMPHASDFSSANISPFTLKDPRARAKQQQLKADFEVYLDGFSPNVQEILEKFKFRNQIRTLVEADILGSLIEKFTSNDVNLSPDPVFAQDGNVRLPGLNNHAMGTIFEELIRRFNEENNEEAGEHFTPRDVVKLMANSIFRPIAEDILDATYRVYDGVCGTGGMLSVAEETLDQLASEHGKDVSIHLSARRSTPKPTPSARQICCSKGRARPPKTASTALPYPRIPSRP
jgi:type I restriction enzyme M protein